MSPNRPLARRKRPARRVDSAARYREYESRKSQIAATARSAAEYEARIRQLARELGL